MFLVDLAPSFAYHSRWLMHTLLIRIRGTEVRLSWNHSEGFQHKTISYFESFFFVSHFKIAMVLWSEKVEIRIEKRD